MDILESFLVEYYLIIYILFIPVAFLILLVISWLGKK